MLGMLENYATPEIAESWRRFYEQEKRKKRKRQPPRIPIKLQIFSTLQAHEAGLTWKELRRFYRKASLSRGLKALITEGVVKKDNNSGRYWTEYSANGWVYAGKKLGSVPFFGIWASRESNQEERTFIVDKKGADANRSSIGRPSFKEVVRKPEPTRFVRLFHEEKKEFDRLKIWLKFQEKQAWFRENYPCEFEKFMALERVKAKQCVKPNSEAVMKDFESFLKDCGIT